MAAIVECPSRGEQIPRSTWARHLGPARARRDVVIGRLEAARRDGEDDGDERGTRPERRGRLHLRTDGNVKVDTQAVMFSDVTVRRKRTGAVSSRPPGALAVDDVQSARSNESRKA